MFKKILMSALGWTLAGSVLAGSLGSQSAVWMRIPVDARSSAMADSLSAATDDTGALGINPAGLALVKKPTMAFSHSFWAEDLTLEHAAYGDSLGGVGFAVGGSYFNFGSVDQFSVASGSPVANGTFTPQAMAFSAGGGFELSKSFFAGAAANWLGQNISNAWDSAFSANLGLLYQNESGFSAGAALLNAGQMLAGFSLPLQCSLGAAYRLPLTGVSPDLTDHSATLCGQWDYLPDSSLSSLNFGGEYWYHQLIALRAGYRFSAYGSTEGLHGLTAGAGFKLSGFELSYALVTLGSLGNSNQVSLSLQL